jgi:Tol biopolymer transport system component
MGEIYRAKDTRLDRVVAVKVLPAGFAENEQFRVRLEREAKTISALNHPHICTLHDIGREQVDGAAVDFLVLELIEGESLAERIAKGPLPGALVIDYGIQIASALDAAHRRGIVHRDLKPANVMITKSGAKLLDFGLARSGSGTAVLQAGSSLPTAERPHDRPLTEQGTILGTFQYMAPEQLEGEAADARTDIFALGAVLFEMSTGRKAFEGKSRTSLIAAIVSSHPPNVSTVMPLSPPALDHVIHKCLEKDPDDRWQSARDVAAELEWVSRDGSRAGVPAAVSKRRKNRERLAWGVAAAAVVAATAFAIGYARRAPRPGPVVRFLIPPAEKMVALGPPRISPDGRYVAFDAADTGGRRHIWVRALDELEPRLVPGTEGVRARPIWSPDSRQIAFFQGGKLKKVDIAGGPAQVLCDAPTGADGSWSPQGVILFDGRGADPLWSAPAAGGPPRVEIEADGKEVRGAGWPEFLPDGRHYIAGLNMTNDITEMTMVVGELGSRERKTLFKTRSQVHFAEPGFLIYVREDTLVAHPFDVRKLEFSGDPVPIGDKLAPGDLGLGAFSTSRNGILAFRPGADRRSQLVWVDRSGKEVGVASPDAQHGDFAMSPDGTRLAVDIVGDQGRDIWVRGLGRGTTTRFTFHPGDDIQPLWTPDGRHIVFSSSRSGEMDLYIKNSAGTGEEQLLFADKSEKHASDISRDGRWLVYHHRSGNTGWDIAALPLFGEKKPIPIAATQFGELAALLSPDAQFVAYHANDSGRNEVYVQEFPEARSKWQVSTAGGRQPSWSADGREIFYLAPDGTLLAVPVTVGDAFAAGTPQPLFQPRVMGIAVRGLIRPWRDGRFIVHAPLGKEATPPITVVMNWTEALRR